MEKWRVGMLRKIQYFLVLLLWLLILLPLYFFEAELSVFIYIITVAVTKRQAVTGAQYLAVSKLALFSTFVCFCVDRTRNA